MDEIERAQLSQLVLETNKRSSKYRVRLEFQGNLSSTGPSQGLVKKK